MHDDIVYNNYNMNMMLYNYYAMLLLNIGIGYRYRPLSATFYWLSEYRQNVVLVHL